MLQILDIVLNMYNMWFMNKFRTTIKILRTEAGLTQEDLAAQVGVVRQTIAYIERGEYMPSLKLARDIAGVFKQSIESVFIFPDEQ